MSTVTLTSSSSGRSLSSILWSALGKVAGKIGDRDDLIPGGCHSLELEITGTVDDEPISIDLDAILTVGHDQQKASSATPDQTQLLANILAKLNANTRNKILQELPELFAEAGGRLPEVSNELVAEAGEMLKRLRAKKMINSRGAVRCEYRVNNDTAPPTLPFVPHVLPDDGVSAHSSAVG